MANTTVHVVDVVRHGEKLILPEGISYDSAIKAIQRQAQYEEEVVAVTEEIDCFVLDGALAFSKAMARKFGWATAEPTRGFFGKEPPQLIAIEVEAGKTVQVPWGKFTLPGVDGWVATSHSKKNTGRVIFSINAQIKQKHKGIVTELAELTRMYLKEESVYRGKAIQVRFRNDDGESFPVPEPKFMDLNDVDPNGLIFSEEVDAQVRTNLFTPIIRTAAVKASRIPLKRGVLLEGKYGTGKTLAARVTAYHAVQNGWTFLYILTPTELPEAIEFAKNYQPCVIFAEDIDRVTVEGSGKRDSATNEVLNILDGIDTKTTQVMVVLTTNFVETINKAMFRPGRLDAVITIKPPDANAVERLIRMYAGSQLSKDEDLSTASKELEGNIPAVIRECVERSKLYAITLASDRDLEACKNCPKLTSEAILLSAKYMKTQMDLLAPKEVKKVTPLHEAAKVLGSAMMGVGEKANATN